MVPEYKEGKIKLTALLSDTEGAATEHPVGAPFVFVPVRKGPDPLAEDLTLRPANAADLASVDTLYRGELPRRCSKRDYPPSVLGVPALPLIARATPAAASFGQLTYLTEDSEGRVLAAGGWEPLAPAGRLSDGPRSAMCGRFGPPTPNHLRKGLRRPS